ncbi:WD40 repeat domain-containing serine/threonine protein kinase [Amycolatopsis jejuensis]|uniref:WD40 repeat domain-containing serine/threonine protein kinase n=1 Tax=Amycolatopsis jejuensis TaxID=330084 RepID=UPI0005256946|nr:serine/threonine-protein kinase [Amycolatopsis jejuensis]
MRFRKQRKAVPAAPTLTGTESTVDEGGGIGWEIGRTVLGTYRIEHELGAGGMGVVHRVRHLGWGMDLAVKSPLPRMWLSGLGAFVEEAEVWVGLPPHPNLCTCHYVRVLDGVPRIFAEYVEGGTVAEAIRAGQVRGLGRILDIAIQMAWGLHVAHEAGVVHQDVKPSNALLTRDGVVKITDFGLARAQQRSGPSGPLEGTESILVTHRGLTPAYASPEQYNGLRAGRRGDVWSWAVSVLELFTGKVTWRIGALAAAAVDEVRIPKSVARLLRECLTYDPAARPADLGVLADRLIEIYAKETGKPYPRPATSAVAVLADGFNNKALSMVDLGRTNQAKEFWNAALEADPRHLDATVNAALCRWHEAEITDIDLVEHLDRFRFSVPDGDSRAQDLADVLAAVHTERRDDGQEIPHVSLAGYDGESCPLRIAGEYAADGGEDGIVRWWNLQTGQCERTMIGHSGPVHAVSTMDGQIISGGADGTVRLWDPNTGTCLRIYQGDSSIRTIATDGKSIVAGDEAGTLWWWHVETANVQQTVHAHDGPVNHLVLLPNGDLLSAGEDGLIRHGDQIFRGHRKAVYTLALLPDGFVSGGHDGTLRQWDFTGRCVRVMTYQHRVLDVLSSPFHAVAVDGHNLVAGNNSGELTWWDLDTGRCLRTVDVDGTIDQVTLHQGTAFFSGSERTVYQWALKTGTPAPWRYSRPRSTVDLGRQADIFERHLGAARALLDRGNAPGAAGELRAARSVAGFENNPDLAQLWRQTGHSGQRTTIIGSRQTRHLDAPGHLARAVAITSNGRHALCSTADTLLRWWDLTTGQCKQVLDSDDGLAHEIDVTPDGRSAVSVGDHYVHWWDLSQGKRRAARPLDDELITFAAAITPDGRRALTGSTDHLLRWWNLPTGEYRTLAGHDGHLNGVAVTANGRYALSGAADRTMRWWDLATGECLRVFPDESGGSIGAVAVTPDGRYAVSGSTTGAVVAWDLATGTGRPLPAGHTAQINSVAISADGRHALSGGEDQTMRWWDLFAGRCLHQVKRTYVASAAMTPSAHHVVSGMSDGSLLLWEIDWDYGFPGDS